MSEDGSVVESGVRNLAMNMQGYARGGTENAAFESVALHLLYWGNAE
jgi:hypothetical protein